MPTWLTYPAKAHRDPSCWCAPPARTPVFTDFIRTGMVPVDAGVDLVGTLVAALLYPEQVFSQTASTAAGFALGLVQPAILGTRMTALRVSTRVGFQYDSDPVTNAADPPDSRIADIIASIMDKMLVRIRDSDATGGAGAAIDLAMMPLPVRAFREGVVFPDGMEPYCRDSTFAVEIIDVATPLRRLALTDACLVSLEYRFEAVFERAMET